MAPQDGASGSIDPVLSPDPGRASTTRLPRLVLAAVAVLVPTVCELAKPQSLWLLEPVLPVVEALVWLSAGVAVVGAVQVTIRRRILSAAVAGVFLAAAVWFTNWAIYDPRSYFVVHRPAFDAIAGDVRSGVVGSSDDHGGEALPVLLRDLSRNGRAVVVGRQDGKPLVLVPQWFGIPDGAAGYVFYDGEVAPATIVDLYGDPARVASGIELGGGWWYVGGDVR